MATLIIAVDFEVFGRVQGVFFRKYTQKQAKDLGLKGWCRNTENGTVAGQMEGSQEQINEMKDWLRTKGSPSSRITKADFKNERKVNNNSFASFTVN